MRRTMTRTTSSIYTGSLLTRNILQGMLWHFPWTEFPLQPSNTASKHCLTPIEVIGSNYRSANPWWHQTNQCNKYKTCQYIFPVLRTNKQEAHKFQHPLYTPVPWNSIYTIPYTCNIAASTGWRTDNMHWKTLDKDQTHPVSSGKVPVIKQQLHPEFLKPDYPGRPTITWKLGKTSL